MLGRRRDMLDDRFIKRDQADAIALALARYARDAATVRAESSLLRSARRTPSTSRRRVSKETLVLVSASYSVT